MDALSSDPASASVTEPQRAMLDYARKLTLLPSSVEEADVRALKAAGFSDSAIHDIAAVTGYFNFVNRIALGLGVELEPQLRG